MQRMHKNMQDVRYELKVKSLRSKIKKRALERMGHVFQMPDDRKAKILILGWMKDLETVPRSKEGHRKTVNYWQGLLREAGFPYTDIGRLTKDRKAWKGQIRDQMGHIEEWERKGGH